MRTLLTMSHERGLSIAGLRVRATIPSWRVLVSLILIASGCTYVIPVQRSMGLFTSTRANASVVSSSALLAPIGLVATATGPTTISLTWSPSPSAIASGYEVYRISDGEPDYTLITTQVGRNTTTYGDVGLMPVMGYTYYIKTIYEGWSSTPSPTSTAITTS